MEKIISPKITVTEPRNLHQLKLMFQQRKDRCEFFLKEEHEKGGVSSRSEYQTKLGTVTALERSLDFFLETLYDKLEDILKLSDRMGCNNLQAFGKKELELEPFENRLMEASVRIESEISRVMGDMVKEQKKVEKPFNDVR